MAYRWFFPLSVFHYIFNFMQFIVIIRDVDSMSQHKFPKLSTFENIPTIRKKKLSKKKYKNPPKLRIKQFPE